MATWDSISSGDVLPELVKKPGVTDLVKYAAGSGDFNPLHHDYNFPQVEMIGSIIVHGRFKYAMLGELVSNWLNHEGRITKIGCQYRGMDLPNAAITCAGRVTNKHEVEGKKVVELELWTKNTEGKKTTVGSAVVTFD